MSEELKRFICLGCGFLYDEALGLPEHGIAPGTRWADIPENWACPDCFSPKHLFQMVEIPYAAGGPICRGWAPSCRRLSPHSISSRGGKP